MYYFYNGKKPSNNFGLISSILLIIIFLTIFFFFTRFNSLEELLEYKFQILCILFVAVSVLFSYYRKKGIFHTHKIQLTDDNLLINDFIIPIKNIQLDIYTTSKDFSRYHLWDSKGIFSIYSVLEDDLLDNFKTKYPETTNTFEEMSSKTKGYLVIVKRHKVKLEYDLESGKFIIKEKKKPKIKILPKFFISDPKYKQGDTFS
jgi:hypothetical protein